MLPKKHYRGPFQLYKVVCCVLFGYLFLTVSHTFRKVPNSRLDVIEKQPYLPRSFPRWGDAQGISLVSLVDCMRQLIQQKTSFVEHSDIFPETPYLIDKSGVYTSAAVLARIPNPIHYPERWLPSEALANEALQLLLSSSSNSSNATDATMTNTTKQRSWPALTNAIVHHDGFPFIMVYGDYRDCNYHNWGTKTSIPHFSFCANIGMSCNYAFPIAHYKMAEDAKDSAEEWQKTFEEQDQSFPWVSKIRKVMFRGSIWWPSHAMIHPRWKLFRTAHDSPYRDTLFDIGAVRVDDHSVDLDQIGGLKNYINMTENGRFAALLDMDGTSWSSRFASLLCQDSVILKVEPQYVDYFHFQLEPWEHFIPVRIDLEDLEAKAAFIADPSNDAQLQAIVRNTRAWCQENMIRSKLVTDLLDSWEFYVRQLDRNDPAWVETWKRDKPSLSMDQRV